MKFKEFRCPYCKETGVMPFDDPKFSPAVNEFGESFPANWSQVFTHDDCKVRIRPRWTYDVTDLHETPMLNSDLAGATDINLLKIQ